MPTLLNMVEGDTAPARIFTVMRDGAAVDLTNASVNFILRDSSTWQTTNSGHQTCTLDQNPATGKVTYTFQPGDLASGNIHFGDLQITYSGGSVETNFDQIVIYVRPKVTSVS